MFRATITSSDVPTISYTITPFITPEFTLFAPKAIDRHRKDLSYQNWDFLIEQRLPSQFVARVGYVGSIGRHLFTRYQVNLIDPATGERPLGPFSQFGLKANDANNSFNALQLSLERRFNNGFLWQTQYMWSHGITDASIGAGRERGVSARIDRSSGPYDVRHTSTTNAIYQLPFGSGRRYLSSSGLISAILGGSELSGLATASTGLPVDITINSSASQFARWKPVDSATRLSARRFDLRCQPDYRQLVQPGCRNTTPHPTRNAVSVLITFEKPLGLPLTLLRGHTWAIKTDRGSTDPYLLN